MVVAVLAERLVTPHAVHGNAQQLGVEFLKFGKKFVVQAHLVAAHRTPVGRIERQNYRSAAQFAQGQSLIGCDVKSEIRSRGSGR